MTTDSHTPFRCPTCGPINDVNLAQDAAVFYPIIMVGGMLKVQWAGRDILVTDQSVECAGCQGEPTLADGTPIIVGELS